ncbi:5-(carboxyamino)imidazole ribonucleotide mutase [bacterium]|nr:5-(carboxyamino)imidazole ribonucleotide mutase [bacterium]
MNKRNSLKVLVLMGSKSDEAVMERCHKYLESFEIEYESHIASAHRDPDKVDELASGAAERGIEVIIAGAGMAAALPGVIAARTQLPVIGVPLDASPLGGQDALLSIVQMPPGIPVATVAIGSAGARNAAVLAAQIIGLRDADVRGKLDEFKSRGFKW